MHFLAAEAPESKLKVIIPRKKNVAYNVHHRQNHIFIVIRDEQRFNSELLVAPLSDPSQTQVGAHTMSVVLDMGVQNADCFGKLFLIFLRVHYM